MAKRFAFFYQCVKVFKSGRKNESFWGFQQKNKFLHKNKTFYTDVRIHLVSRKEHHLILFQLFPMDPYAYNHDYKSIEDVINSYIWFHYKFIKYLWFVVQEFHFQMLKRWRSRPLADHSPGIFVSSIINRIFNWSKNCH